MKALFTALAMTCLLSACELPMPVTPGYVSSNDPGAPATLGCDGKIVSHEAIAVNALATTQASCRAPVLPPQ